MVGGSEGGSGFQHLAYATKNTMDNLLQNFEV